MHGEIIDQEDAEETEGDETVAESILKANVSLEFLAFCLMRSMGFS